MLGKREATRLVKTAMLAETGKGLESVKLVDRVVRKVATDAELRRVYKVCKKSGLEAAWFEIA